MPFDTRTEENIFTTAIEHHAVLEVVEYLVDKFGFEATFVQPVDGQIRRRILKRHLDLTLSVSVMAVINETGAMLLHELVNYCTNIRCR